MVQLKALMLYLESSTKKSFNSSVVQLKVAKSTMELEETFKMFNF